MKKLLVILLGLLVISTIIMAEEKNPYNPELAQKTYTTEELLREEARTTEPVKKSNVLKWLEDYESTTPEPTIKTPLPPNSSDYTALLIIGIVLLILLILFGGKLIRAITATLRKMTKQVFQTTIIWLMGIGISIISFKVLTRWRYCKYPFYYLVTNALPILIFGGLCLFASRRPKEIKWLMWIAIIILLIIEFFLIIQSVPSPITRRVPF